MKEAAIGEDFAGPDIFNVGGEFFQRWQIGLSDVNILTHNNLLMGNWNCAIKYPLCCSNYMPHLSDASSLPDLARNQLIYIETRITVQKINHNTINALRAMHSLSPTVC